MLSHLLPEYFWIPIAYVVIMGHYSTMASSLYLHRSLTHRGVTFAKPVNFFMRFYLWLTTGIDSREWVAVHRKHHSFPDKEGDPHSPVVNGFWSVMLGGFFMYKKTGREPGVLEKYGKGCPDDWLERNVFGKYRSMGILLLLAIDVLIFGYVWGGPIWLCQMLWTPVTGHTVNAIGHAFGYRNTNSKDHSRNIMPLGILMSGEELHNNHHADPAAPKFSMKWWEFDIGWMYITILKMLGLASVKDLQHRARA